MGNKLIFDTQHQRRRMNIVKRKHMLHFFANTARNNTVLDTHYQLRLRRLKNCLLIKRFYPAHINHTHRHIILRKLIGRIKRNFYHFTKCQHRHLLTFTHGVRFPHLKGLRNAWNVHAPPVAARIAQRHGPRRNECRVKCANKLSFVAGCKNFQLRNHAQVRNVKHAVVSSAIGSHQASAVNRKHNIGVYKRVVNNNLVKRALQKRRVNGNHGFHARNCKPRRHANCVFFGNSHVNRAVGERVEERLGSSASAHRCRYRNNRVVVAPFVHQRITKHRGVRRRMRRLGQHLARLRIVRAHAVKLHRILNGGRKTFAFMRYNMHQNRAVRGQRHAQKVAQLLDVVPVQRRCAHNAQLLVHHGRLRQKQLLHGVFHAAAHVHGSAAQLPLRLKAALRCVARVAVGVA